MNDEFNVDACLDDCGTCDEHFLDEPQDSRGLPLSWCREYEERHKDWPTSCESIYDYDSIPDVVVTDADVDWELRLHSRLIML